MSATVTLPAPPQPYLGTGLPAVTRGTAHRNGQQHRVVAIGSGFGGLTATKALKHDLANIADALTFLTRMTTQGTAHVHAQASLWLHVMPTTAALFTTVGVLITLYFAIIRGPRRSPRREMTTAAEYFSCDGQLRRPQRTRKGRR